MSISEMADHTHSIKTAMVFLTMAAIWFLVCPVRDG